MLVLHYTGMQSARDAVNRLRDPASRVSSHYVVDEDGAVLRLVAEEHRAWHAGVSYWRGRRGLNDSSIGIEIVNPGHEWGYRAFPAPQIAAVIALCRTILDRWPIPPQHVVGHSDIAPTRKQDPGELFPWSQLADCGIGLYPPQPGELAGDAASIAAFLSEIGFDPEGEPLSAIVAAFQRHWRPARVSGEVDAETCGRARAVAVAFSRSGSATR